MRKCNRFQPYFTGPLHEVFTNASPCFDAVLMTIKILPLPTARFFHVFPSSSAGALWLNTLQISQVQLPMRTVHVDDAEIISALRAIQQGEAKGPVLIHCKHGLDRTGLVAAMYGMVVQGWSKQDAVADMTQGGFGDTRRMKYGLDYIHDVDVQAVRSALASGACSTNPLAACAVKELFKQLI